MKNTIESLKALLEKYREMKLNPNKMLIGLYDIMYFSHTLIGARIKLDLDRSAAFWKTFLKQISFTCDVHCLSVTSKAKPGSVHFDLE